MIILNTAVDVFYCYYYYFLFFVFNKFYSPQNRYIYMRKLKHMQRHSKATHKQQFSLCLRINKSISCAPFCCTLVYAFFLLMCFIWIWAKKKHLKWSHISFFILCVYGFAPVFLKFFVACFFVYLVNRFCQVIEDKTKTSMTKLHNWLYEIYYDWNEKKIRQRMKRKNQ